MTAPSTESAYRNPFSLIMPAASLAEPIIAPWSHAVSSAMPSFDTEAAASRDQPIWRVVLPSMTRAHDMLETGARELAHEQDLLIQADGRFEALVSDLGSASSLSLQGADAELVATLVTSGALPSASVEVESGTADGLADRAGDWLRETWQQMQSLIAYTTWTETLIEGRLIARSALGRTGDTLTAWIASVTHEEAALHNRAVGLALASKQALIQKLTLVIRGALMVTGLVAAPGSALLAIPAIWRYLNQLRAELFGT